MSCYGEKMKPLWWEKNPFYMNIIWFVCEAESYIYIDRKDYDAGLEEQLWAIGVGLA